MNQLNLFLNLIEVFKGVKGELVYNKIEELDHKGLEMLDLDQRGIY